MPTLAIVLLTVIVLAVVIGLGVLIFRLQRRAQSVVPRAADRAGGKDTVVAFADDGTPLTEAEDPPAGPDRDGAGFERVLAEELEARHPESREDAGERQGAGDGTTS